MQLEGCGHAHAKMPRSYAKHRVLRNQLLWDIHYKVCTPQTTIAFTESTQRYQLQNTFGRFHRRRIKNARSLKTRKCKVRNKVGSNNNGRNNKRSCQHLAAL